MTKKHTKIIYVQDAFTVHKGHIKCTVAQKQAHWPPFLVLIFKKHLRWTSGLTSQYNVIDSVKYLNNFTFMQRQSHEYYPYVVFSGSLYFFLMFQSYRELVIIALYYAYRNIFSTFFIINHYNWRSNQLWHIDRMFSQTIHVMKYP